MPDARVRGIVVAGRAQGFHGRTRDATAHCCRACCGHPQTWAHTVSPPTKHSQPGTMPRLANAVGARILAHAQPISEPRGRVKFKGAYMDAMRAKAPEAAKYNDAVQSNALVHARVSQPPQLVSTMFLSCRCLLPSLSLPRVVSCCADAVVVRSTCTPYGRSRFDT